MLSSNVQRDIPAAWPTGIKLTNRVFMTYSGVTMMIQWYLKVSITVLKSNGCPYEEKRISYDKSTSQTAIRSVTATISALNLLFLCVVPSSVNSASGGEGVLATVGCKTARPEWCYRVTIMVF
jgi:hypothetical protein